jgi:glyoxylase-like metal-dependent hydrolase (beta-lactamase superfamily II)
VTDTPVNPLAETRLRENVFVWTLGGEGIATSYGSNCTGFVGREAALLVDPFIAPVLARLVEERLREISPVPVRHVLLTHHHTDHALGAGWFASRGVEVIAHPACRKAMGAEHPGLIASRRSRPEIASLFQDARAYLPSRTLEGNITLDLGGTEVRVLHPGHNHTPGDMVAHLPEESVAVCGDMVSAGYHVNYEDAAVGSLERGLETLRALGACTLVPGHGPSGGPELLDRQARYHCAIRDAARSEPDSARRERPRGQICEFVTLPGEARSCGILCGEAALTRRELQSRRLGRRWRELRHAWP